MNARTERKIMRRKAAWAETLRRRKNEHREPYVSGASYVRFDVGLEIQIYDLPPILDDDLIRIELFKQFRRAAEYCDDGHSLDSNLNSTMRYVNGYLEMVIHSEFVRYFNERYPGLAAFREKWIRLQWAKLAEQGKTPKATARFVSLHYRGQGKERNNLCDIPF